MFGSIVIGWFLTFGVVPLQNEMIGASQFSVESGRITTMANVGLEATIDDRFRVYTELDNYQYKASGLYFNPYRIDYTIGAEFRVNKYISLFANHRCIHEVKYTTEQTPGFSENETKLYVTFHGESKVR